MIKETTFIYNRDKDYNLATSLRGISHMNLYGYIFEFYRMWFNEHNSDLRNYTSTKRDNNANWSSHIVIADYDTTEEATITIAPVLRNGKHYTLKLSLIWDKVLNSFYISIATDISKHTVFLRVLQDFKNLKIIRHSDRIFIYQPHMKEITHFLKTLYESLDHTS